MKKINYTDLQKLCKYQSSSRKLINIYFEQKVLNSVIFNRGDILQNMQGFIFQFLCFFLGVWKKQKAKNWPEFHTSDPNNLASHSQKKKKKNSVSPGNKVTKCHGNAFEIEKWNFFFDVQLNHL